MAAEAGYPRVFISYTHETPTHESRVLELAQWLRDQGLDCRIDQFEQFPAEGWTKWMRNQIRQAEFVLVVCTEPYLRRFEGEEEPGIGRGATWEGTIISLELYREALRNTKFVPVILSSTDEANIPDVLRDYQHFDVSVEVDKDKLYRLLMGQPEVTPHPVGRPRRPGRRRAQKVVLFHETGRADQWNHPGSATRDEAYSRVRDITPRGFSTDALVGLITPNRLASAKCFVLTIGPTGTTKLGSDERQAVRSYVAGGGGLLLLDTYFGDQHHGADLSGLAVVYGISFNADVAVPEGSNPAKVQDDIYKAVATSPWTIVARPTPEEEISSHDEQARAIHALLLKDVREVKTVSCCSLALKEDAVPILSSSPPNMLVEVEYVDATTPKIKRSKKKPGVSAYLMAASKRGKVVAIGGWKTFLNGFIDDRGCDNAQLFDNIIRWLCQ